MAPDANFESMSYNLFAVNDNFFNSKSDPDINFYRDLYPFDTISPFDLQWLEFSDRKLHCITSSKRIWQRRRELSVFVHKEIYFKPRTDLSINSNDVESPCIEIHHKKNKNTLFSVMYRPPNVDMTVFEKFCEKSLSANNKTSKNIIFAGDLNIKVSDYESNEKVQHFLSSMFQYNMIPTINRLTRVTRNTVTAIDYIITRTVVSGIQHRSCIIKTDISDHFPIVFALKICEKSKPEFINSSTGNK